MGGGSEALWTRAIRWFPDTGAASLGALDEDHPLKPGHWRRLPRRSGRGPSAGSRASERAPALARLGSLESATARYSVRYAPTWPDPLHVELF
ncbi:MAG: hypothetical protein LBT40_12110, partial [Deltaproteobacteria bacterium]|nr:hypothetical protein [Deltaproteobacteria bacterium]